MSASAWLQRRSEGAPALLRERVLAYAQEGDPAGPDSLGAAGLRALDATLNLGPDRRAALDLLAADALVTLALLAQAEADPAGLASLAQSLRRAATARP
jgi:Flp pilus assembly protein CpaB